MRETGTGGVMRPADWKICLILFATLLFSYSFFFQQVWAPGNPNVTTRTALIVSILEDHTLSIDRFQGNTHDKALSNGHYYSDKAPGLALTALPVVGAVRFVLETAGVNVTTIDERGPTTLFYVFAVLATIATVGVATAAAGVTLYIMARHLGLQRDGALFGAIAFGLATPAWGWATVFFGHMFAGSLMLMAFAIILMLRNSALSPTQLARRGFAIGGLLAWAIVVEFTAGPPCILLALLAVYTLWRAAPTRLSQFVPAAIVGGLLFLLPLFVYNSLAFASPFKIGYESVEGFEGMHQGFFGLTFPKPHVLAQILVSPYRGLFWFSPILLTSVWALLAEPRLRHEGIVRFAVTLIALYYLALNGSYYYWDGGWSTAPRHLMPSVPFLALPLAFLWDDNGRPVRMALAILAALSAVIALVCVSTTTLAPTDYENPLFEFLLPHFATGQIHTIGLALGLKGLAGIIPAVAVWALAFWALRRSLAAQPRTA